MPRDYLNQRERELFGLTFAMHEDIKTYIEANEKYLGKNEKKFLKSSITFYQRFMEELFTRVGNAVGHKMIKDFKGSKVYFETTSSRSKDTVTIDTESVQDLAEGVIDGHCRRCKDQRKDCSIRELFITTQIPEYDEFGVCPYYPA